MENPKDMLAIAITGPGGPDVLVPRTVPVPVPQTGEVLIKIAAAGVNGPDISQREGVYDPPPGASRLPGLEVSGTIAALGPDAGGFAIGDAVVALTNGGGYAQYVAVPAGQVLEKPANWGFEEAATLPETYFTIQQTLVERAALKKGQTVLIHGGAGGIGATAIQVCRLHGARPVVTVGSPEKSAYAKAMGAAETILYSTQDYVAGIKSFTDGRGADVIIDIIGGSYADRNLKAAARGGHIIQLAVREGGKAEINLGLILFNQLTLSGSTLRPQSSATKAALADGLRKTVWPAIADGRIVPPRLRTFPLDQAAKAHEAMEAPGHFGKIVLVA